MLYSGGASGKEPAHQCKRHRFDPLVGKIPRRRAWQPTPVFLPGEFHGQRSLVGYGPQGCKESNARTQVQVYFNTHTHTQLALPPAGPSKRPKPSLSYFLWLRRARPPGKAAPEQSRGFSTRNYPVIKVSAKPILLISFLPT